MQNKELYSREVLAVRIFGLFMVIIFLIGGILSSCSSSKNKQSKTATDTLTNNLTGVVAAEHIKGKELAIGESLSIETPEISFYLERISKDYYLRKSKERTILKTETE